MKSSDEMTLLEKRKAGFDMFYRELVPALVDFVAKMGINPAHEVLKNAVQFAPYLDRALQGMAMANKQNELWLLTRLGYFIGEYYVQKYGGCWYLNEVQGSRYFGRYVVGKFTSLNNPALMLDPFQVSREYTEQQTPRKLEQLLTEVDTEIAMGK